MRVLFASLVLFASAALFLSAGADGGEKKAKGEVTVKGTITCAKCDLGKEKTCMTVVVDKKNDTVYYFDPAGHKKHHGKVCTDAKEGTVTGTVGTKGDKKTITVKNVTFKE